MQDAFIATNHKHLPQQASLYTVLRREGFNVRFVQKGNTDGSDRAKRRAVTETYLLCQDDKPRETCIIITKTYETD